MLSHDRIYDIIKLAAQLATPSIGAAAPGNAAAAQSAAFGSTANRDGSQITAAGPGMFGRAFQQYNNAFKPPPAPVVPPPAVAGAGAAPRKGLLAGPGLDISAMQRDPRAVRRPWAPPPASVPPPPASVPPPMSGSAPPKFQRS